MCGNDRLLQAARSGAGIRAGAHLPPPPTAACPPVSPPPPPRALLQVLASRVRTMMHTARTRSRRITITDGFNPSTRKMINR